MYWIQNAHLYNNVKCVNRNWTSAIHIIKLRLINPNYNWLIQLLYEPSKMKTVQP